MAGKFSKVHNILSRNHSISSKYTHHQTKRPTHRHHLHLMSLCHDVHSGFELVVIKIGKRNLHRQTLRKIRDDYAIPSNIEHISPSKKLLLEISPSYLRAAQVAPTIDLNTVGTSESIREFVNGIGGHVEYSPHSHGMRSSGVLITSAKLYSSSKSANNSPLLFEIALTRFRSSSACSFASNASCFNFLISISGAVRPLTSANSVRAVSMMAITYSLQRLPSTLSLQRQMPVSVSQDGTFSNEPLESQPQEVVSHQSIKMISLQWKIDDVLRKQIDRMLDVIRRNV
uniref:Uncharacterized protein n=1 Tax=Glossina pallidipes TaxID=7398 RepID=A0A1A9ZKJ8_GLOPL